MSVSQACNKLYNDLGKNNIGSQVDLSGYTSSFYTVPSDGYVRISGGSAVGSIAHVYIYGAESGERYYLNIYSVTTSANLGSCQATFVRKGMKIKAVKVDTSSGAVAVFKPLS